MRSLTRILISLLMIRAVPAVAEDCPVKTILAENTKQSLAVYEIIKKEISADEKLKRDLALTELSEPRDNISLMYLADINNDGKREYIFTAPGSGSAGFINVFVFEKRGDKFVYLGTPPKPAKRGDGPWYSQRTLQLGIGDLKFSTALSGGSLTASLSFSGSNPNYVRSIE